MVGLIETLSLLFSGVEKLLAKLDELKPKEIQTVRILTDPFEMSKTAIDRISTVLTAEPDKPQIEIGPPVDADCRVLSITLIPDAAFKTKGLLCLKINDVEELRIDAAGDLTDFSTVNVPLPNEGKKLQRGKKVKLSAWTSDGTASAITAQIHFVR